MMVNRRPDSGGDSIGKPRASTSGGRASGHRARHPIATGVKAVVNAARLFCLAGLLMTLSRMFLLPIAALSLAAAPPQPAPRAVAAADPAAAARVRGHIEFL